MCLWAAACYFGDSLAPGAAWAPCCYPATLQAGHAFSGLRGSAAAPFTALHHPVREHPAPHKRLHTHRARAHTQTRTRTRTPRRLRHTDIYARPTPVSIGTPYPGQSTHHTRREMRI